MKATTIFTGEDMTAIHAMGYGSLEVATHAANAFISGYAVGIDNGLIFTLGEGYKYKDDAADLYSFSVTAHF